MGLWVVLWDVDMNLYSSTGFVQHLGSTLLYCIATKHSTQQVAASRSVTLYVKGVMKENSKMEKHAESKQIMNNFCVAGSVQRTKQPNYLAEEGSFSNSLKPVLMPGCLAVTSNHGCC
eukprot:1145159-Pelagomonas_calceolata.AAC.2